MLALAQFDRLATPIVDLYEQYAQSVLADIARRLAKMEMSSASVWQLQRLTESGAVYQSAIHELSRITGQSEKVLQQQFEKGGLRSAAYDNQIYKAAGLKPLPMNMSPSMLSVLMAGLRKTDGTMRNLTMTTALSARNVFIDAADMAYMKVTTGVSSYDQAIREAVKGAAGQGLSTIDYASGKTDQLDVAMRRTVLSGVAKTTGDLTMASAEDLDVDLVQTSAHAGSRPEHEPWQGKIFSLSGTSKRYPDFVSSTGYGEVDGLCGINCRHTYYPFFEGLSKNAYTAQDRAELANKTVTLDGKEVSQYEASQVQRNIERHIRDWKRQAGALEAAGLDNKDEMDKVRAWQSRARDFVRETGLDRQGAREGGSILVE
jgi:hypothetical protein